MPLAAGTERKTGVADVSFLPTGMYWIELQSGEKIFYGKFMKQ
jgi:hypothetical protein